MLIDNISNKIFKHVLSFLNITLSHFICKKIIFGQLTIFSIIHFLLITKVNLTFKIKNIN